MSWHVNYDEDTRNVRITFDGPTTGQDLRDATSEAILTGKNHGTRAFLVDSRTIRLHASVFALLALPDKQYTAEGADRHSLVAVLMPSDPKEQEGMRFYETVCVNRGWQARCFWSPDEALAWLASASGAGLA